MAHLEGLSAGVLAEMWMCGCKIVMNALLLFAFHTSSQLGSFFVFFKLLLLLGSKSCRGSSFREYLPDPKGVNYLT